MLISRCNDNDFPCIVLINWLSLFSFQASSSIRGCNSSSLNHKLNLNSPFLHGDKTSYQPVFPNIFMVVYVNIMLLIFIKVKPV